MADAIHRIVPPSVSLDRSKALGRERKNEEETAKKAPEDTKKPPKPKAEEPSDLTEPESDKGKKLDISV